MRPPSTPTRRGSFAILVVVSLLASDRAFGDALFIRGDADSNGKLNITDAVTILRSLFSGAGKASIPCLEAADVDDNGKVDVSDALFLLHYLFLQGRPLRRPPRDCELDSTPDDLGCDASPACSTDLDDLALASDATVFVIDRSGSMLDQGELQIAKGYAISAIRQLREGSALGVVIFDRGISRQPPAPPLLRSTAENRAIAERFILGTAGGSGTCVLAGFLSALELLSTSNDRARTIIYFGDGGGTCGGEDESIQIQRTLEEVTEMNTAGVHIHTVGIFDLPPGQEGWLRQIAEQNGGTYHRITR
jgi:hypothetical protein